MKIERKFTFGQRIRRERKRLNLTADYVAEYSGLCRTTQFLYETGKTKASVDYLLKLDAMGFDVDYLLYGDEANDRAQLLSVSSGLLPEIFRMIEFLCQDAQGNALSAEVKSELFADICKLIESKPEIAANHIEWRQAVSDMFYQMRSDKQ
ncbi:helix-turn-helix domain-containing protein [Porticoccaceae bacterium]|nr:helix-turn-helix domain-containing protein [Porticoccaceae bacterium]MDA8682281.1 helix-turn-helix domain-containing protein [Porticoccaceae bacterium]